MIGSLWTFSGKWNPEGDIFKDFIETKSQGKLLWEVTKNFLSSVSKKLRKNIKEDIRWLLDERYSIANLGPHIKKIVTGCRDVLDENYKQWALENEVIPEFEYRSLIYWFSQKLRKVGVKITKQKYKKADKKLGKEIHVITWDKILTSFFMFAKSLNLINVSQRNWNGKEVELKVLDISVKDVRNWLKKWRENSESWIVYIEQDSVHIIDNHFDNINLSLEKWNPEGIKRSFRIRTKTYKDGKTEKYYTLKKTQKIKSIDEVTGEEVQIKESAEIELRLKQFKKFKKYLEAVGFKNSKIKQKRRTSFNIEYISKQTGQKVYAWIDVEDYKGIDDFIEIECVQKDEIPYIIEMLWFSDRKTTTDSTDTLLSDNDDGKDAIEKKYKLWNDGKVYWNDGGIWDIRQI